jgi:hypothetical protein
VSMLPSIQCCAEMSITKASSFATNKLMLIHSIIPASLLLVTIELGLLMMLSLLKQKKIIKNKKMKKLFQPAIFVMSVVIGLSACKKENVQPTDSTAPSMEASTSLNSNGLTLNVARNLVKKGTDSLIYNQGGTLTKVINSPVKYVTYQKAGNVITALTFESNVLRLKVEYTLANGRTTKSVHTSYQSNIGVSKTWLYDYNSDGLLIEKYNKDNTKERFKFVWYSETNLSQVKFYSGNDQHISTLQFQRGGQGQADKLRINSVRTGLDPYLKVFGVQCTTVSNGESMTYPNSPNSNFSESHTFTYDRDGYPTKLDVYDSSNWTLKYTHNYLYSK